MLDITKVRADFPILQQEINGFPLIYFDNGATSQKPQVVIDAISDYYQETNANIHRGVHTLSQRATDAYEAAREIMRQHLNAAYTHEVLFTAGTTHGINLVANGFASILKVGDEVLISAMEHHSNIVPWQLLCEKTGAKLRVIPMNENGELIQAEYQKLLNSNTKLVAVTHISNALGTINPIQEMVMQAHQVEAAFLVDGAQAVPHLQPDVQALNCDFYAFSGHKICGPTGTGILYGKEVWLNKLPPYQGGGEMIKTVTFEKTTYAELPHKFEAGTPHIAGGIALGVAVQYLQRLGFDAIAAHEKKLLDYATDQLLQIEGLKIYGTAAHKTSVISFNVDDIHPYDLGTIIDKKGIAVRTGHHCTQPIMDFFGIPGTIRASFAFYNTTAEIDFFVSALKKAVTMLR
jgi:cysteine desulfurase/selenocysteine lyase